MEQITVFSSKKYDVEYLEKFNEHKALTFHYIESRLSGDTVQLAKGSKAVCLFVNDNADKAVLTALSELGITRIALRCAGYNNIDITTAQALGFSIARVPEYSPEAVAEHTVGLMLTLSRKFHKAYNRVREGNFALDGLMGFNLYKKTVGIIGTGHIGLATIKILVGFGCNIVCNDPVENPDVKALGARYVSKETLLSTADIISLHCPLTHDTKHIINDHALSLMKNGVMLINTSRGALINSKSLIKSLKERKIGQLGMDVYELESELFFEDLSDTIIEDDIFERLISFPNVLITGHQGFFTHEAIATIAQVTNKNLLCLVQDKLSGNEIY